MKHKSLAKRMTILLPFVAIILYCISDYVRAFMTNLPPCSFYTIYHVYCPACGNTRSVTALLQGDILTSLRFNIAPITLLLFALFGYIELATYSFGKPVRLLPRKLGFYLVLLTFLFLYFIIRNFIPYLTP